MDINNAPTSTPKIGLVTKENTDWFDAEDVSVAIDAVTLTEL